MKDKLKTERTQKLNRYIERLIYLKREAGIETQKKIDNQILKFENKIRQMERENQN